MASLEFIHDSSCVAIFEDNLRKNCPAGQALDFELELLSSFFWSHFVTASVKDYYLLGEKKITNILYN